jgi:hypothetical protein
MLKQAVIDSQLYARSSLYGMWPCLIKEVGWTNKCLVLGVGPCLPGKNVSMEKPSALWKTHLVVISGLIRRQKAKKKKHGAHIALGNPPQKKSSRESHRQIWVVWGRCGQRVHDHHCCPFSPGLTEVGYVSERGTPCLCRRASNTKVMGSVWWHEIDGGEEVNKVRG